MSQPLIDLQHISKSFDGEMVLDDLSLSIKENKFRNSTRPQRMRKIHHFALLSVVSPHRIREMLSSTAGYHQASTK